MPRPKGSAELIAARRHQALRLLDEGFSFNEVGRMLGAAASSVMRWRDTAEGGGEEALKVRSPPRPPTLTDRQGRTLVKLLLKGAMANGFSTELWTARRVGTLIQQHCRVQFHRSHVARLLHELGFSCQKPERRALKCDERKIEEWKRTRWPQVKKRCAVGCHIVFADESGFMMIPSVRCTWAPVGQTPIVRHYYRRDRISAIAGCRRAPSASSWDSTFGGIRSISLGRKSMTSSGI